MAEADLRNMIMNFRVSDLQVLLGFAGRNKTGKKQELQSRALDLTKMKSPAVAMKIKELHNRRYHHQLGTRPNNYDIPDRTLTDRPLSNYESAMNNNYGSRCNPNVRPMSINQGPSPSYSGKPYMPPQQSQPHYPPYLDVKFKDLPFYDTLHVLLKPFSLVPVDPVDRVHENSYSFTLTPQQAHDLAVSKDSTGNYECQVLLRFCILDTDTEQDDNFPPNISVKVNGKPVPLPNAIPTNRPGVEPKRPSRPVNITPFTKLSPTVTNVITVTWSSTYGRSYVAVLTVARLVTSYTLLHRLRNRGCRAAEHTKVMIMDKLQQDHDSDIATTSLQASLICPLGKLKMELPCRAHTCSHIACFDASLYIQLNEKKPKWRCPVCDKPALFKNLILDGLFMDILSQVPSECTDVQLHDDGSWKPIMPVKEPKEVQKIAPEQTKKKPSKPVEVVDISSDSETDDTWKNNKSSCNSQDTESPPLVFIPNCPTPPVSAYSPASSVMSTNYTTSTQMVEPVPVCLTSNVDSELPSSEPLNILPDIIPNAENSMPSTSCSGLGSTYSPYFTDTSAFCTNTSNTFQEQSLTDNNQTSEPIKYFDLFTLLSLPESEQEKYKGLAEKDSLPEEIISLD